MTCDQCGSATTRRRLCADCARDQRRDERDHATEFFDCPDCGRDTSGPGVVCYRCRGGSQ